MANGLETKTSWRDIMNVTFYLWCWTVLVLATGFVVGNTLRSDLSVAGVFCEKARN